jgi:hypothetical protein
MTDRLRRPSTVKLPGHGRGSATIAVDDAPVESLDGQPAGGRTATAFVEDISPDGAALVVLAGETRACEASSLLQFPTAQAAAEALIGHTVLVVVNESGRPVILGVVADRLWETRDDVDAVEAQATLPSGQAVAVHADKRRLDFEAADEIRLTCGKSSLVLRADGTVIVRGVNIVSRALQSHKIRGATVSVN